jgi:hypothetical protein
VEGGVRVTTHRTEQQYARAEAEADRVRRNSTPRINAQVDHDTRARLEQLAAADRLTLSRHIDLLDREWDVERYLQTNAGLVSLSGILIGATVDRRGLLLSAAVFGFFLEHAVSGWCPPLPIFRRMGVRTRAEINREKYAVKALRGDFGALAADHAAARSGPL